MDRFGCLGSTIRTPSGYFDLLSPSVDDIRLTDIALSLSKICRYGGHTPRFYSVAEHCFHACEMAHADGVGDDCLRAVLMHDATEAYVGDVVKPLKVLMPEYMVIESRVEDVIGRRFGICFHDFEQTIKLYDRSMLKAEKIQMWPEDSEEWEGFDSVDVSGVRLCYWSCDEACSKFFDLACRLGIA